jgi:hypothetical protein
MGGRGMHEKAIGELKTGLAFDAIPTDDYQANRVDSSGCRNISTARSCDGIEKAKTSG